jgi:hypothetical protein
MSFQPLVLILSSAESRVSPGDLGSVKTRSSSSLTGSSVVHELHISHHRAPELTWNRTPGSYTCIPALCAFRIRAPSASSPQHGPQFVSTEQCPTGVSATILIVERRLHSEQCDEATANVNIAKEKDQICSRKILTRKTLLQVDSRQLSRDIRLFGRL